MARKEKQMKLWFLTDHSIDKIVDAHVTYVTSPRMEPDEDNSVFKEQEGKLPLWVPAFKVVEEGNPAPRKAILKPKYRFLLHVIIMRCRRNNKGACRLDYAFFTKLLGKSFSDMLHNLSLMGIIYLGDAFTVGKESRNIDLLDWNISFYDNIDNLIIRNYLSELDKENKKNRKESDKEIAETLGKNFYEYYSNNLSLLDLNKKNEGLEYVFNRKYDSPQSEQYYKSTIEDFDKNELRITSVDYRGRIYHYLTNCPRLLRKYFNLKIDVDIANSQPLLFCNFLIKEFNIDYSIIKFIRDIDNSLLINSNQDNNIYYKGKQLCKLLKDSDLEVHIFKDIPTDVLLYIYSCMKGLFWDDFTKTFAELDRSEVKESLFREVFYSHSRTMRNKEYGKVFAEIYPTVWHVIRAMKKDAEQLCDRITKVESEIFHNVLSECFKREWRVVGIHDAVVVLDVQENERVNNDELIEIIMSEYRQHGLIPTVHLEKF